MGNMRPAADSYTYDVGIGSASAIRERTANILRSFGYQLLRDDGNERVYMETQWQKRAPVDGQERMRGGEIISRVQISGSPRVVAGGPTLYHALVTIENRFVPTHGTQREARETQPSLSYVQSIVKGMSVALGSTARPVANDPRPF